MKRGSASLPIFLEIVLGIDNLVFISITTNRLPVEKQHIGRKLGLAGALIMRIVFLCFASYLVHMTATLFTIDLGVYNHGFSMRDLVLLLGGAYLIYKGISEIIDMLRLTEVKAEHSHEHKALHMITLPQAIATIMVMDVVFSIDSVITAVGMADHLIIMIIAVMVAVVMMMVFIDPISNFINGHPEMKMLALTFIVAIGALLVIDSAGFHTGIELLHMPLEKLIVYFAMVFCIVLELIQMRYNKNFVDLEEEPLAGGDCRSTRPFEPRCSSASRRSARRPLVPSMPPNRLRRRPPRFSSAATFTLWLPSTARMPRRFESRCSPARPLSVR